MAARLWPCLIAAVLLAAPSSAQESIVDLRQGTDMALAVSPDGARVVVDLLGRLWQLPPSGGGAVPLTPDGEHARHPRFSPDGRHIAYQRRIGGSWDVWLLDVQTGARRALTRGPFDDVHPDFLPEGNTIVFASDREGAFSLWLLPTGGGDATRLTSDEGQASFPAVSDTGDIAYVVRDADAWSLRSLSSGAGNLLLHRSDQPIAAPSWRPGGGVVLFTELGPDSSRLRMLILSNERVIKDLSDDEDVFASRPDWISAAQYLYTADGQIWRRGIAEVRRDPVHLFASALVEDLRPTPVLAGERLPRPARGIAGATAHTDGAVAFVALGDLWLAVGERLEQLTDDAYVESDPTFTPDGDALIFSSDRGGNMDLWRLDLETRLLEALTGGPAKAYRPAVDPAGQYVAYLSTRGLGPWAESELRVLELEGTGGADSMLAGRLINAETPRWSPVGGRELSVIAALATDTASRNILRFDSGLRLIGSEALDPEAGAVPAVERPIAPAVPMLEAAADVADYVVRVGRLFDGVRDTYARHVDVHVEDGRIAAIVGRGLRALPETVIDASEMTMLPGLIETHVHQSDLAGERLGRIWLALGVTTVREVTADTDEALARSEAWSTGQRLGPRLIVTPSAVAPAGALPETAREVLIDAAGRMLAGPVHGVFDGFGAHPGTQAPATGPAALIGRMVIAANGFEMRTSARGIQYQDIYSTIIASGRVSPTMLGVAAADDLSRRGALSGLSSRIYAELYSAEERLGFSATWRDGATLALAQRPGTLTRLIRGGALVAIATDAPVVPYGIGLHRELALLADAGIANDQILRMATSEGALALGIDTETGTLEPGKRADFVIVDGDPLARIGDLARVRAVGLAGRWIEAEALVDAGRSSPLRAGSLGPAAP